MDDREREEILEDEKVRHGHRERQKFLESGVVATAVTAIVFGVAMLSTNISWLPALGFGALLGLVIGFGKEIT